MSRPLVKLILRIVGVLLALLLLVVLILSLIPVPTDPFIPDAEAGVGSVAYRPSYSGLQREFPPLTSPEDNPQTPEKVELGRQLFFDPILSAEQNRSCASCHHPDLGFSNGEKNAEGRTNRNIPTLWEVGYAQSLHWDGSVDTLERQASIPLTHPKEMGLTPEKVEEVLQGVPAYKPLFAAAFEDGKISADNTYRALAAFQRTLTSNNSPFDRYAAGEKEALTPQQRRGLTLFRSGATRCFECHTAPTFALDAFRVIGVPSGDLGRAGVDPEGAEGAFRVPTLRNIALTAPYMHNGSIATLEGVIDFYAKGGGRAHDKENIDPFVSGFTLTDSEKEDLVSFLYALTDESALPELPSVALSGLPTVAQIENRARLTAQRQNATIVGGTANPSRDPRTTTITAGQPIQPVIDKALPGDTILIEYGTYHERVSIDTNDLTIEGVPNAAGEYPIFDGQNTLSEGIIASGNNFKAGKLRLINFTDNGILVEGVVGVHLYDLITENTGTYGVYPTKSTDVLVERVKASGVNDAAIYAGQCQNVVIRDSEGFDSVIGIELENTINGEAYNNHVYNNSLGLFVVVLPQLHAKVSRNTKLYDNLVENNNHENFAEEGMAAALVPPGVGILSLGGDDVEIYGNKIQDHRTAGVAIFSLTTAYDANEIDVGPNPENNWVHDNEYSNNGYDPVAFVRNLGIPVGDLLWDGSGWNNRFDEQNVQKGFPVILPSDRWGTWQKRVHWRVLQWIIKLSG